MARRDFRNSPKLESLEIRQVLSSAAPTADAQYLLELVNLARTNPSQAADVATSNLSGDEKATVDFYNVKLDQVKTAIAASPVQPPLAYSDQLNQSATKQSQDQVNMGTQTHSGSDGSDAQTRVARAGYTDATKVGENTYAYADNVNDALKAFLIDWGVTGSPHRQTIQEPSVAASDVYTQVGFGIVSTNKPGIGPVVVTQDFAAKKSDQAFLLGVAYDDNSHNGLYTPGEGRGDVTVEVTNVATGATASTNTSAAGGYQLQLAPGTYQIAARVGNQVIRSQTTTIGTENVKVDFVTNTPWQGSVTTPIVPPAPVIAPVSIPLRTAVVTPPVAVPVVVPTTPIVSIPVIATPPSTPTIAVAVIPTITPVVTPTPVSIPVIDTTRLVAITTPTIANNNAVSSNMPVTPSNVDAVRFDVSWMLSWSQWTIAKKMS